MNIWMDIIYFYFYFFNILYNFICVIGFFFYYCSIQFYIIYSTQCYFLKIFLNSNQRIYRRNYVVGILQRVIKYLMHMPQSPTSLQTEWVLRYFTKSCKIFTAYAIITDVVIPLVIYR
jgi:hypothetical protein